MPSSFAETDYLHKSWNGLPVSYMPELDGGGLFFADDFIELLTSLNHRPPCGHILDWCSGAGFIGYAALAFGFGNHLTLTDRHQPSLDAAATTVKNNDLDTLVDIHCGDGLAVLPPDAKYDLVLGLPPAFPNRVMTEALYPHDSKANPDFYVDPDWHLHADFFANIRKHLSPNGRIILMESTNASHIDTFEPMIEAGGLRLAGWQWSRKRGTDMWYLFACRDDAPEPFMIETPED